MGVVHNLVDGWSVCAVRGSYLDLDVHYPPETLGEIAFAGASPARLPNGTRTTCMYIG